MLLNEMLPSDLESNCTSYSRLRKSGADKHDEDYETKLMEYKREKENLETLESQME